MKRILALLTILVLTASLFTGCSPDELSFLQLNQEISTLETYTMTGAMNWNTDLEALLSAGALDTSEADAQREIIDLIEAEGLKHFTYAYSVDVNSEAMEARYSAGGKELCSLVLIKDAYYANFDGLLELVKRNDSEALQNTELYANLETLKGKYLTITVEELLEQGVAPRELMQPAQFQSSLVKQQELRKNLLAYFMDFAKTELAGHNPGLVTKQYSSTLNADVYGYSVNLDQVPMMGLDLMLYLLDHLDGTEALITKIMSEPLLLEQSGMDAETAQTQVKSTFEELRYDLDATRAQLTEVMASERDSKAFSSQIQSTVGNTVVKTQIAKLGPKKYWNQVQVTLDNPNGLFPVKNATLDATVTLDASKTPAINTPQTTIPFNTFNDTLPHSLVLEPDYNSASYDAGLLGTEYLDVDMVNRDDHWFISLGTIPEHFRNLIQRSGSTIAISGKTLTSPADYFVNGDITYIALGAFKDSSVTVLWDDYYRTLTLED